MKCNYKFRKGTRKGELCNELNCKQHSTRDNNTILEKQSSQEQQLQLQQQQQQKIVTVSVTIPTDDKNKKLNELDEKKSNLEKSIKKRLVHEDNIKQKILDLDTSIENKTSIMKQFLNIKKLDINSTEYYKNQLYIDQALIIPWNKYYNIRKQIGSSSSSINSISQFLQNHTLIKSFIDNIKSEFDKSIYGMENIKNEIINYICKFITNPHSQKNNIALYGSAGVCKTKFIKVLAKALNIPCKIISLGGMKDSSYLLGHSQTYQDSKCGIIVQSIIESQIMNPILYFDELDKISNGELGQDIYSVLSNITDSTINTNFKDRYFSNLLIDLSKVFYIFTFNDISKINKVLLDRLNVIYVENPTKKEKLIILKNYCLKELLENIGIINDISFEDRCYQMIIDYTDKQIDTRISSGIRESTRILEKILLEINKELLLNTTNMNDNIIYYEQFIQYFNKLKSQFIFLNIDNNPPPHMYS
jgi:Lon-like ATP-dependent protease